MKETNAYTEKRRYPRATTHIPVRYRKQGDEAEAAGVGALTGNISAGGLLLRTKEWISAACHLVLELDIPNQTKPITTTSKVVWIKDAAAGGHRYEVGCEFMEITLKDQELISQYVKTLPGD